VINLPTAESPAAAVGLHRDRLKPNTQATIRINGPKSGGKKAETVTGKTDLSERLRAA
jgi:biopolymer transport protein TolR